MKRIVAIDLGATNSAIAIHEVRRRDGLFVTPQCPGVAAVLDRGGRALTPSVVAEDDHGHLQVGYEAEARACTSPATVMSATRAIAEDVAIPLGQRGSLSPQEAGNHLILYLKSLAEEKLGQSIDEAVIAVPAHYGLRAQQMTVEAAVLAGLRVAQLVYQPVAAALMYCAFDSRRNLRVMTYDLGGSTFNATVLDRNEGVLSAASILSYDGDHHLGGYNFDLSLAIWLARRHGMEIDANDPVDHAFRAKLMMLAEKAKVALSSAEDCRVFESGRDLTDRHGTALAIDLVLKRTEFEALIRDDIDATIALCMRALAKAPSPILPDSLDEILMVGGSSRIPLVARRLEEAFRKKPRVVEPDLAVVLGAALVAGSLASGHPIYTGHGRVETSLPPRSIPPSTERYRRVAEVGRGSSAIVWRGEDSFLERTVALKCPVPGLLAEKPHYRAIFDREAHLLAKLRHPNIIPLYDTHDREPDGPMLVMHYADGNLRQAIERSNSLVILALGKIASGLAAALDHCAEQGVAHRDVKPDNVLLDVSGHAYLADFGLAARVDEEGSWRHPVGAKAYLAPELFLDVLAEGQTDLKRQVDQFSLGVLLYETLTGEWPYGSPGDRQPPMEGRWGSCTAARLLRGEPMKSCSARNPRVPEAVDDVIARMLRLDPRERYPSNEAAAKQFSAALEGSGPASVRVFVACEDSDRDRVEDLIAHMERHGLRIWWERALRVGRTRYQEVENAMAASDVMLIVLSGHSVASDEVRTKWSYWLDYLQKPVIPLVIEECRPPYELYSRQPIDGRRRTTEDLAFEIARAARTAQGSHESRVWRLDGTASWAEPADTGGTQRLKAGGDAYFPAHYRADDLRIDLNDLLGKMPGK